MGYQQTQIKFKYYQKKCIIEYRIQGKKVFMKFNKQQEMEIHVKTGWDENNRIFYVRISY